MGWGGFSGAGSDGFRQSIAREMVERENRARRRAPGARRVPEPDDRPDPRAQWDEVEGRWVVWNEDEQRWVPLADDDGSSRGD